MLDVEGEISSRDITEAGDCVAQLDCGAGGLFSFVLTAVSLISWCWGPVCGTSCVISLSPPPVLGTMFCCGVSISWTGNRMFRPEFSDELVSFSEMSTLDALFPGLLLLLLLLIRFVLFLLSSNTPEWTDPLLVSLATAWWSPSRPAPAITTGWSVSLL